jgi:hypothetical protein
LMDEKFHVGWTRVEGADSNRPSDDRIAAD